MRGNRVQGLFEVDISKVKYEIKSKDEKLSERKNDLDLFLQLAFTIVPTFSVYTTCKHVRTVAITN